MAESNVKGLGTKENPWQLITPSGSSEYQMYRDQAANPPALVCLVGKTELRYQLRCIEDLHAMLKAHGVWVLLGSADEQRPAAPGTVEAWGRSADNPVGGWYGRLSSVASAASRRNPCLSSTVSSRSRMSSPRNSNFTLCFHLK